MKRHYIIILFFILAGLLVVGFSLQSTQDIRSRAALPTPTPLLVSQPVPLPLKTTLPPYIRLVVADETDDRLTVGIYVDSGGASVSEVRTTLRYNEEALAIIKDNIQTLGVLPVHSVNGLSRGIIDVSFFADAEAGHRLLQTIGDELVARLVFAKNGQQRPRSIQLLKEDSGLYVQAGETAKNILNSVEDIEFP